MLTSFTLVFVNGHDGPHQLFASWASSGGCAVYKKLRTMATTYPQSYFVRIWHHDPIFKGFSLNEYCQSAIKLTQEKRIQKAFFFFLLILGLLH